MRNYNKGSQHQESRATGSQYILKLFILIDSKSLKVLRHFCPLTTIYTKPQPFTGQGAARGLLNSMLAAKSEASESFRKPLLMALACHVPGKNNQVAQKETMAPTELLLLESRPGIGMFPLVTRQLRDTLKAIGTKVRHCLTSPMGLWLQVPHLPFQTE